MKKEELIKKLEERVETLKGCEKAFEEAGNKVLADSYFWQRVEVRRVIRIIKEIED